MFIYYVWYYSTLYPSVKSIKLPVNICASSSPITATPCFQPSACLLTVTRLSIPSIKTATVTFWLNQILTLQTRRSWNWTAGQANPFLVICTGPVCMRGCCWPYTTEVSGSQNAFSERQDKLNKVSSSSHAYKMNFIWCCSASAEDLWRPSDCDRGERLLHGESLPRHTEGRLVLWGVCWWHASRDCSQAWLVPTAR